jgi:hypothetical protein
VVSENGENRNSQSGSSVRTGELQLEGIPAQAGIAIQHGAVSPKTSQDGAVSPKTSQYGATSPKTGQTVEAVIPVDHEIDRQPFLQDNKSTMPVASVIPAVSGIPDEAPAALLDSNPQPSDASMAPVAQPSNPRRSARLQQKFQGAATENGAQRKRRMPK